MGQIQFSYSILVTIDEVKTSSLLASTAKAEGRVIQQLSLHFFSDPDLRVINKEHLQHDYETDVITFDNSFGQDICGDIMVSVDRVRDNAQHYSVSFEDELDRVIIHGLLHLLGYNDKSGDEMRTMRAKEDHYLNLRTH